MQAPFDNIVQHLFHQPSLHSVTVDELENMAQQHPYFAAAHFLLLKKMQDTDHPQFNTQLHKTTLYFNNPLWLQYLLQPETVADFRVSESAPFITDEQVATAAVAEEKENAYTTGYATATAYQLKEEEVLLERETAESAIEEPVIRQQEDTAPKHSNGGIMDVITEVFNEEPSDTAHLPVFEEKAAGATAIPATENIINTEEVVQNEEVIFDEEEKFPEPVYTADGNDNTTTSLQEHVAEHLVGDEEKGDNAGGSDDIKNEEQSHVEEIATEEKAYKYDEPEKNNVAGYQTENTPGEIAATHETLAEEAPVFANEETITPVDETAADADVQITVEDAQSPAPEEAFTVDSSNEDVTPSVIATIEENNDAVNYHEEVPVTNTDEIITTTELLQTEEPAAENITAPVIEETPVQNHDDTDKVEFSKESATEEEKPLIRTIIETPASKHDFLFEPYHTVDYFASQGIKLSKLEANSKDKLGKQLKSFTEWLKSMKKLPQASIDKILSENEESKVVADAIHSIEKKDVITEAMAEVFEKQGMMNEAAGIYQKLSLLNPAKSAYFAAKIEALKH